MKKIFFAIFLLCLHIPSFAKKTEDMYIMRHTSKGQLFFISENIFHSTNRTFNLPFDITYLNSSDSVSIKMTVYNDQLTRVDSVALVTTDDRYVCPNVHSIYNEKEKKFWTHRCDCAFSYKATKKCFIQSIHKLGRKLQNLLKFCQNNPFFYVVVLLFLCKIVSYYNLFSLL